MTTTAEQVRAYRGPAILSFGFRPFFLAGALWAAVAVALWLPMFSGHLHLPIAFTPIQWHVHELIYGYVPAIVAGFLLTAVPNWTGRLPVTGTPLLILFLLWLVGRLTVLCSAWVGPALTALVDLSFLSALLIVIGREIVAGNNTRNLKVLAVVSLLFVGNAIYHWEAAVGGDNNYGTRTGIAAIVMLIMLIGGRIVPSFTRNWLAQRQPGRLPIPFNQFDIVIIAISAAALLSWVAAPEHNLTALMATLAGVLNLTRLARWAGDRTAAEPLVLILHIAYAFVPIGFVCLALSIWQPDLIVPAGALHAWTVGAIGLMTLAVMTRAGLGHTGQALTATVPIRLIYAMAVIAACARVAAAFDISRQAMLHASAAAWIAAFTGFIIVYAPLLTRTRPRHNT